MKTNGASPQAKLRELRVMKKTILEWQCIVDLDQALTRNHGIFGKGRYADMVADALSAQ